MPKIDPVAFYGPLGAIVDAYLYAVREKLVANPKPTAGAARMAEEIAKNIHSVYGALQPTKPFLGTAIPFTPEAAAVYEQESTRAERHHGAQHQRLQAVRPAHHERPQDRWHPCRDCGRAGRQR